MLTVDSIARFAAVLADRTRVGICLALLDRRAWTVGELARHVGVARSTASEHVTLLVTTGLLAAERQGRHRYVRLADAESAQLIEDLAAAVGEPERPSSLRTVRAAHQLAAARTCYDHLAGALGVALFDALVAAGLIDAHHGLILTEAGGTWFGDLAGPEVLHPQGRRPLVRTCLDWTQRRSHLGGSLGAALCHQLLERRWISPAAQHRGVTVTPSGAEALNDLLDLDIETLRPHVSLTDAAMLEVARRVHDDVGAVCFVARWDNFAVHHEPAVQIREQRQWPRDIPREAKEEG